MVFKHPLGITLEINGQEVEGVLFYLFQILKLLLRFKL